MSLTPEEREEALQALGEKWGIEISNTFRDLYAAIEVSREHEYRLLKVLEHIKDLTNSMDPPLVRLAMINHAIWRAIADENGAG